MLASFHVTKLSVTKDLLHQKPANLCKNWDWETGYLTGGDISLLREMSWFWARQNVRTFLKQRTKLISLGK